MLIIKSFPASNRTVPAG